MLEPFGPEIWIADGPCVNFYGFAYPTRMVVIRLANGDLWVWSPIAFDVALNESIDHLGPVRHLVSPNKIHHLFLAEWQVAYPTAQIWGPQETISKRRDLAFAGALGNDPPQAWNGQIDQYCFDNSLFIDEIAFFHRASHSVIIADLSENFSAEFLAANWSWWQRPIALLWKIVEGWGYAPLELRASFRHRETARAKLRAILASAPENVVMAHGTVAKGNGGDYLRQAFDWLI